jgi:hypothetical protein
LLLNAPEVIPQVYTTPWQCAHGTSFCSSIRIGAPGCIAMIFFLCLIPLALILMCLARMLPAEAPNGGDEAAPEQCGILSLFRCVHRDFHRSSQNSTSFRAIVAEFWASYFWAPIVLLLIVCSLIFGFFYLLLQIIMCPCRQLAPAHAADAATEPTQQQPVGADARVGMQTACNQSVSEQSAAHRLQELDRMLSEGLVTVEEHKRKRSAILECMEPLELEQVRASA